LIAKLGMALENKEATPEDVTNMMVRDMEEKKIKQKLEDYKQLKSSKRITFQQMIDLEMEFQKVIYSYFNHFLVHS